MEKLRIVEWNINHRLGSSKAAMPNWVTEEIQDKNAHIYIFTECSCRVSNWKELCEATFDSRKYLLFSSNNDQVGNNDVVIVVNKEFIEVISVHSLVAEGHKAPDHLQLNCRSKNTGKLFTVVGLRIHAMDISDEEKREQLKVVMQHITEEQSVIIAGDFNCNRRSFVDIAKWNINAIDDIVSEEYNRITPEGASWARDVSTEDKYCFALDHFLVKGIKDFNVHPYDRKFVKREHNIYKWGTDFQARYGWDKPENTVPAPYPDHAILSADFSI